MELIGRVWSGTAVLPRSPVCGETVGVDRVVTHARAAPMRGGEDPAERAGLRPVDSSSRAVASCGAAQCGP
jgi:hypothetical protein